MLVIKNDEIIPRANVIVLEEVRADCDFRRCKHLRILVDESKPFAECRDCKQQLNPMQTLARFAREETNWKLQLDELKKTNIEYEKRSRCKCQHCGKMTRI